MNEHNVLTWPLELYELYYERICIMLDSHIPLSRAEGLARIDTWKRRNEILSGASR